MLLFFNKRMLFGTPRREEVFLISYPFALFHIRPDSRVFRRCARRLLALRTSTRGIASTSTLTGCAKGSQAQLGLRLVPPQSTCRWRTVERAVGHDEHDVICRRILFKQMLSAQNRP